MVEAGASAASSIDGLGIRLRVRGSSVSMNPVSRNSPLSPIRQEIPSVGSAIENTTLQPPLWREKLAIGALTLSFCDAVDGSSTGTSVPWMWALLRLPRFRGASHADDHDHRFIPNLSNCDSLTIPKSISL